MFKIKKISVKVLIRKYKDLYWGTVIVNNNLDVFQFFCYDTTCFSTLKELKNEIKTFCKFKNLRISKYIKEDL